MSLFLKSISLKFLLTTNHRKVNKSSREKY